MHTLRLFFSSKVNLLSIAILLVISLNSFAISKKGGAETKKSAEVYELTNQFLDGLEAQEAASDHIYRFVDADGTVISEMSVKEQDALDNQKLQKLMLKSDKIFTTQGLSYYLVD